MIKVKECDSQVCNMRMVFSESPCFKKTDLLLTKLRVNIEQSRNAERSTTT